MSLESENRDITDVGGIDSKVDYQKYEHPPLDLVIFVRDRERGIDVGEGTKFPVTVRIMCPDIRVVSRLAAIFEPSDPNTRNQYNLSTLKNEIVAYRCMNAKSRIARVGEIIGKNGVPYEFPKSDIDGIAFQNDDDMPWIDAVMNLGYPGVNGKWVMYYHATANNKLKQQEWRSYISRVNMEVIDGPGVVMVAGE
jgi:hypothetical protein